MIPTVPVVVPPSVGSSSKAGGIMNCSSGKRGAYELHKAELDDIWQQDTTPEQTNQNDLDNRKILNNTNDTHVEKKNKFSYLDTSSDDDDVDDNNYHQQYASESKIMSRQVDPIAPHVGLASSVDAATSDKMSKKVSIWDDDSDDG